MEQTVELAVSSGEAGSSGPGADDVTSAPATAVGKSSEDARSPGIAKYSDATAVTAVAATAAESVGFGEAPRPEIAMYNASTETELAESFLVGSRSTRCRKLSRR